MELKYANAAVAASGGAAFNRTAYGIEMPMRDSEAAVIADF